MVLSANEGEYCAASESVIELVWLNRLLNENTKANFAPKL